MEYIKPTVREAQAQVREQMRAESNIDPAVSLGCEAMPAGPPERGPSACAYFAAKHRRGECGQFYPLHQLCAWNSQRHREERELQ